MLSPQDIEQDNLNDTVATAKFENPNNVVSLQPLSMIDVDATDKNMDDTDMTEQTMTYQDVGQQHKTWDYENSHQPFDASVTRESSGGFYTKHSPTNR